MELEDVISRLPKTAMITKTMYEGSDIVIYTKNKDFFVNGSADIKAIVSEIRKRINLRPDHAITLPEAEAKAKIMQIVPKEAEIQDILFEPEFGRVLILAQKPGIVIGKTGETLREIKQQTFWSPEIQRMPAYVSKIVNKAREIVHEEAKYRQQFLNKIGEKIQLKKGSKEGWVRFSALGGFSEVGRSCVFLQTKESKVLLDCGVNNGSTNVNPYIDAPEFDLDSLDAVIISHAHLDHSGFAPYLYEYGYKGPLYTTLPTRDVMTLLQIDYLDVMQRETGNAPYSSNGIKGAIKHSVTLDYNEVCDITPDMRLTFQNAGHILGSALTHIHIGEGMHNLLYTSDLKYGPSKLLEPAYTGFSRIETMILESTYGGPKDIIPPKRDADLNLINVIKKTALKGGKTIIPAFAVGRSQEVMVVLAEEYRNGNLDIPVYIDGMVWNATAIHMTYPEFLSRKLQRQIFHQDDNPFTSEVFQRVASMNERQAVIDDNKPGVVITTSGMITGGPIMEYLKCLGGDKKNTLAFIGYQAEGTMGSRIQKGWRDFPVSDNNGEKRIMKMEAEIETVEGFSGHSDRNQLINFVARQKSRPERIFLNHGEQSKSLNLASTLHKLFKVETSVPSNLDAVRLK